MQSKQLLLKKPNLITIIIKIIIYPKPKTYFRVRVNIYDNNDNDDKNSIRVHDNDGVMAIRLRSIAGWGVVPRMAPPPST